MNAAQPTDRRARRKAETREKLLEAARGVFARQGIETTRINEITDAANVGFGSFYNHFDSKDAIVAAVVEETARDVGAAIDVATVHLEDPAEIVAVSHRVLVGLATADPELGWLLVRLELTHGVVSRGLGAYAARDLDLGRTHGRFAIDDVPLTLASTGGALLGAMRALLAGHPPEGTAERHAAVVLRILGLDVDEADEIASRPMPPI